MKNSYFLISILLLAGCASNSINSTHTIENTPPDQPGIPSTEIKRIVQSNYGQLDACYNRSLDESGDENFSGKLKVKWLIDKTGSVQWVKKISDFGSEYGLFDCVASKIQGWNFPQPKGGSKVFVTFPFVFRPLK